MDYTLEFQWLNGRRYRIWLSNVKDTTSVPIGELFVPESTTLRDKAEALRGGLCAVLNAEVGYGVLESGN